MMTKMSDHVLTEQEFHETTEKLAKDCMASIGDKRVHFIMYAFSITKDGQPQGEDVISSFAGEGSLGVTIETLYRAIHVVLEVALKRLNAAAAGEGGPVDPSLH